MELILDNTYGVSRIWSQEKDFLRGFKAQVWYCFGKATQFASELKARRRFAVDAAERRNHGSVQERFRAYRQYPVGRALQLRQEPQGVSNYHRQGRAVQSCRLH